MGRIGYFVLVTAAVLVIEWWAMAALSIALTETHALIAIIIALVVAALVSVADDRRLV